MSSLQLPTVKQTQTGATFPQFPLSMDISPSTMSNGRKHIEECILLPFGSDEFVLISSGQAGAVEDSVAVGMEKYGGKISGIIINNLREDKYNNINDFLSRILHPVIKDVDKSSPEVRYNILQHIVPKERCRLLKFLQDTYENSSGAEFVADCENFAQQLKDKRNAMAMDIFSTFPPLMSRIDLTTRSSQRCDESPGITHDVKTSAIENSAQDTTNTFPHETSTVSKKLSSDEMFGTLSHHKELLKVSLQASEEAERTVQEVFGILEALLAFVRSGEGCPGVDESSHSPKHSSVLNLFCKNATGLSEKVCASCERCEGFYACFDKIDNVSFLHWLICRLLSVSSSPDNSSAFQRALLQWEETQKESLASVERFTSALKWIAIPSIRKTDVVAQAIQTKIQLLMSRFGTEEYVHLVDNQASDHVIKSTGSTVQPFFFKRANDLNTLPFRTMDVFVSGTDVPNLTSTMKKTLLLYGSSEIPSMFSFPVEAVCLPRTDKGESTEEGYLLTLFRSREGKQRPYLFTGGCNFKVLREQITCFRLTLLHSNIHNAKYDPTLRTKINSCIPYSATCEADLLTNVEANLKMESIETTVSLKVQKLLGQCLNYKFHFLQLTPSLTTDLPGDEQSLRAVALYLVSNATNYYISFPNMLPSSIKITDTIKYAPSESTWYRHIDTTNKVQSNTMFHSQIPPDIEPNHAHFREIRVRDQNAKQGSDSQSAGSSQSSVGIHAASGLTDIWRLLISWCRNIIQTLFSPMQWVWDLIIPMKSFHY